MIDTFFTDQNSTQVMLTLNHVFHRVDNTLSNGAQAYKLLPEQQLWTLDDFFVNNSSKWIDRCDTPTYSGRAFSPYRIWWGRSEGSPVYGTGLVRQSELIQRHQGHHVPCGFFAGQPLALPKQVPKIP